ncbi:S41 family peptidase [Caulobacter segnis]
MKTAGILALIGALALASSAAAQSPSSPALSNPDFETGEVGQLPPGWRFPAPAETGYHAEISNTEPQAGKRAARVWRDKTVAKTAGAFGSLAQVLDAAALRGHRIRYSAAVRVDDRGGGVGLWLRVDEAGGKQGFFDNMDDRPITASGWAVQTIEAYVSEEAQSLLLGLLVKGDADARIDSVKLEDLGPAEATPTGEAKTYLDHALYLLEQSHINSATADWPALRAQAYKAAAGATTPRQTHAAIRAVISRLGERHTFLRPPTPARPSDGAPNLQGAASVAPLPVGRMEGPVAVIALPRLMRDLTNPNDDGARYQAAITDFLKTANNAKACGWIIDLRGHGGGDMWPGMRGLAPLLGEGPPGAFAGKSGRKPWAATTAEVRQSLARPDAPVAVLVGPRTASSGEMIAIGFVGRPLTRLFGQPTAGLTTANSSIVLSDGAVLALTSAYVEDRLGHRYDGRMQPHEIVALDAAEAAATAWLATQGCN